jgi:hypothetical protein
VIDAGFFATWPLLTSKAVRKHFPEAAETTKGHMRQVKSGVRSTKTQAQEHPEIEEAMSELAKYEPNTVTSTSKSRKRPNLHTLIKQGGSR